MANKICNMDCFNCVFDDCKYNGSQTAKEGLMLRNAGCLTDRQLATDIEIRKKSAKKSNKSAERKEKALAWRREYNKRNKEKIKEYKKKYYEEHKEEYAVRNYVNGRKKATEGA